MSRAEKGYELPTEVNPGVYQCFRVYVPDDPLYLAAFWAAYEYFTTWIAWERDPEKRGRDAAAVWRDGFEAARTEWEVGVRCMDLDVRQSSTDPCKLEKSYGSDEWEVFADLTLCKIPAIGALYPETTGSAEVADLLWWLKELLQEAHDLLVGAAPDPVGSLAYSITADIGIYSWQIAQHIILVFSGYSEAERVVKLGAFDWQKMFDEVFCELKADYNDPDARQSWLDQLSDAIFQWLEGTADWLYELLNDTAAMLVGESKNTYPRAALSTSGGGSGFGFDEPECEGEYFEVDFEFNLDDYDWQPVYYDGKWWAKYHAGGGWGTYSTLGDYKYYARIEYTGVGAFRWDKVQVWLNATNPTGYTILRFPRFYPFDHQFLQAAGGLSTWTFEPGVVSTGLSVACQSQYPSIFNPRLIRRVKIWGFGVNPWG